MLKISWSYTVKLLQLRLRPEIIQNYCRYYILPELFRYSVYSVLANMSSTHTIPQGITRYHRAYYYLRLQTLELRPTGPFVLYEVELHLQLVIIWEHV